MDKIVIECGEAGYYLVCGELDRNEFLLKSLIKKILIGKSGYFYFEDDELLPDEDKVLKTLSAVSYLTSEKSPKLNRVKG